MPQRRRYLAKRDLDFVSLLKYITITIVRTVNKKRSVYTTLLSDWKEAAKEKKLFQPPLFLRIHI